MGIIGGTINGKDVLGMENNFEIVVKNGSGQDILKCNLELEKDSKVKLFSLMRIFEELAFKTFEYTAGKEGKASDMSKEWLEKHSKSSWEDRLKMMSGSDNEESTRTDMYFDEGFKVSSSYKTKFILGEQ